MYVKGAATTVPGLALLPDTGNNKLIFATAIALLTVGAVMFTIAFVSDLRSHKASK